jgi:DnaK suppressor protein
MHENIAKALKARLSELTGRVAEIDSELRKPLSSDSEERATDLENLEALEAIENSEMNEVHQIQEALKQISDGTYGICAQCGAHIDPKPPKGAADCDPMHFMRCVKIFRWYWTGSGHGYGRIRQAAA